VINKDVKSEILIKRYFHWWRGSL